MEKVKALNKVLEQELKDRYSNEGKEQDDGDDSGGGSVRGIPGGLRPKLGGEGGSIEQL